MYFAMDVDDGVLAAGGIAARPALCCVWSAGDAAAPLAASVSAGCSCVTVGSTGGGCFCFMKQVIVQEIPEVQAVERSRPPRIARNLPVLKIVQPDRVQQRAGVQTVDNPAPQVVGGGSWEAILVETLVMALEVHECVEKRVAEEVVVYSQRSKLLRLRFGGREWEERGPVALAQEEWQDAFFH